MNAIAKSIRRLRKRDGLTQDALAETLHVTRQAVSSWETGKTQPDIDTLSAIAGAFGTDITEVIYGERRVPGQRPEDRKRKMITACALGLVTLTLLLLALFLLPVLKKQAELTFRSQGYYLFLTIGYPMLYLFAAMFLISVFSVFWDFRIKPTVFRRILLILSAVFVLLYAGTIAVGFSGVMTRCTVRLYNLMLYICVSYFEEVPAFFLLPGIGLYLGLKKRQ